MATTQKALEISAFLAERLKLRLSTLAFATSFDTDGNPLISIGALTAGSHSAVIKVMPYPWTNAKDVLGNTAIQYTPHSILLATELSASAGVGTILTTQEVSHLLGEIMGKGCHFDWYQETNGSAPAASTFTSASKLKASFELSLEYPLIQLQ